MSCSYCGSAINSSDTYCPNCGTRVAGSALATGDGSGAHTRTPTGPRRDAGLAFLLELLPGLFGFLGIGHVYVGEVVRGLLLLAGYWVFISFELLALLGTVGWCLTPLNLLIPIGSAFWLKRDLESHPTAGTI